MPNYNKTLIMGHLTRDIEIRTAGSTQVGNFGIAVNHKYKTARGEQREDVTFIDCTAWGKTAETMAQYLSKGKPVFIEGRLKMEEWEDKNGGGKRTKHVIVVDNFQFVGSGGGSGAVGSGNSKPAVDHSDIPFAPDPCGGFHT